MRGICVDALNMGGRPTVNQLKTIGATGIRIEIRDDKKFYDYANTLAQGGIQLAYLIGPSTEAPQSILLQATAPDIIIIGNEPDGEGASSWIMEPDEYINLWNANVSMIKQLLPITSLCTAGFVGDPTYLSNVWSKLLIKPDLVNKHYPNNAGELQSYSKFNRPVCCFEWCYRTASLKQMQAWTKMLSVCTLHNTWFCWSDAMVKTMGLVSKNGARHVAATRLQQSWAGLVK